MKALEDFNFLRGRAVGPLFSTLAGRPYTATATREDLSSVLSFCGLDNKRYKSHSFRIDAASDAALRGFSDAQIRLMGRWHSDAFRQYTRLPYKWLHMYPGSHESGFMLVPLVASFLPSYALSCCRFYKGLLFSPDTLGMDRGVIQFCLKSAEVLYAV